MKNNNKSKLKIVIGLGLLLLCSMGVLGYIVVNNIIKDKPLFISKYSENRGYKGMYDDLKGEENPVSLKAEYTGSAIYAGGQLQKNKISVIAKYSDRSEEINDYTCDMLSDDFRLSEGRNTVTVKYKNLSTSFNVDAVNVGSLSYIPSYIIYDVDDKSAEEKINQINNGTLTYKDAFADVAFTGDSQIKALATNGIFGMDRIIAEVGQSLDYFEDNFDAIAQMASDRKVILVHYGINSLSTSEKDRNEKLDRYRNLLKRLKERVPNVRIIVSGLFSVSDTIPNRKPQYDYIAQYNLGVFKICEDLGIEYLSDNEYMDEHQEVFGADGLHETKQFYTDYWLKNIIKTMGL